MYGFRKGISAGTFDGLTAFGISFKSALVIAQVVGYMCAKFWGIKFIAELNFKRRSFYILAFIGAAELNLLLLAICPLPWNIVFVFFNGLSLGLIWGLVFSYIEGRKGTDIIAIILSINFIFSSGITKSIGRWLLSNHIVTELWMPFVTGLFFLPLLFLSVWMLNKLPPPSEEEVQSKGERIPLNHQQRKALLKSFGFGLFCIILINLLLTVLREIKDNYGVEIIKIVKPDFNPSLFTGMETLASIIILVILFFTILVKNHYKSILVHQFILVSCFLVLFITTYQIPKAGSNPIALMVIYTVGLYAGYNTLQCLFLDRFIAAFSIKGNIGFFFYIMDSVAYLGSCTFIIFKEIYTPQLNWLQVFIITSTSASIIGLTSVAAAHYYFKLTFEKQSLLQTSITKTHATTF